jgi:ureidoacrylate peracid hydrolase
LRANQVKRLYLAGVSTDLAIQTTAREAHDRDYHLTILQDACGAASMEEHLTTLNQLKKIADILPCDKLGSF